MLLMDTTLKSGEKLVQLLHQAPDTNVQNASKCKSHNYKPLYQSIDVNSQTKASSAFNKCTVASASTIAVDNKNRFGDETKQIDFTGGANHNSTANLTQDSNQEAVRNQVTDQNQSENRAKNIQINKEIAKLHIPTNVNRKEATHNNHTQMVANQPEVKTSQPMTVNKRETTQCDSNHLVASQRINEPDSMSMEFSDEMLLNIVPIQNKATTSNQNQTVTNQPPLLRIQINRPNHYHSHLNIQPNVVVNQPTVRNLLQTNQSINQSAEQVKQSVTMVPLNESYLFTQPNQNVCQSQNVEQKNLDQNINIAKNQILDITLVEDVNSLKRTRPKSPISIDQIEIRPVSEVDSPKRIRVKSPVIKEPLPKICNRMSNSKDFDFNWFKKMFGNVDKPKEEFKEENTTNNYVTSVVERDRSMPIIQNVVSLAQSHVSSQSLRNNKNVVDPKLRNIALKLTVVKVKQGNVPSTDNSLKFKETQKISNIFGKKTSVINTTSEIYTERQMNSAQNGNLRGSELPVLSVKSATEIDAGAASVQAGHYYESSDVLDTAQKPPVINTTPEIHTERQIVRAQNWNLRGSELPMVSVKSTTTTDAGAANVQEGNYYESSDVVEIVQKPSVINTTPEIYTERLLVRAQNGNLRGSELPVLSVTSTTATDAGAANVQAGNYCVHITPLKTTV